MAFEKEFLQMTTEVVTVAPLSAHTAYGAPGYSTSETSYTAYVEPAARLVVTQLGVEEVANATVFVLSSSASIGLQDQLTLSDGRIPRLLRVDKVNDDEGQHHLEVLIG